jgi:regulator of protease activity HflC (stomatin/prohibitin superfamily)
MSDDSAELLEAVRDIRKLLELLAEPAIAQRDAKLRNELRQIVGASKQKQESVCLMNGERTQKEIHAEASMNKGNLSTLVSKLSEAKLLTGDPKLPNLAISIPPNFFESDATK